MTTKPNTRGVWKIKPEKVEEVKGLVAQGLSQREVAQKAAVSQYTVWHISKGTYDTDKPLAKVFQKEELFYHY